MGEKLSAEKAAVLRLDLQNIASVAASIQCQEDTWDEELFEKIRNVREDIIRA